MSRPVVLFHSDDWGLAGIRDREGFEDLKAAGLDLGERPYDFYSLETAEDLHALYEVLLRHRDSAGRPPCMVFNFILANVDFPRVIEAGFRRLSMVSLHEGLPGNWRRPGLLEAYEKGIKEGLVYPALHGVTHFCRRAAVQQACRAFAKGHPAVVSIHAVNFHSTLKDYRKFTLQCLDRFLNQLEER